MIATIPAGDALAIVGISSGFVGALATILALAFRRQFIVERQELRQIQHNSVRMKFMADSLVDGQQALKQLVEYNLASIHELFEHSLTSKDVDEMLDAVHGIQLRADRGLHELLLLSSRTSDRISGAQHVSQSTGGVRAQRILHWLIEEEDDVEVRRLLKVTAETMDARLDELSRELQP